MVGAFNNNVTFVMCRGSVCFKNMVLEGTFSSTEGALYHHYLPYAYCNNTIDTESISPFFIFRAIFLKIR